MMFDGTVIQLATAPISILITLILLILKIEELAEYLLEALGCFFVCM